jgi:thiol-disulfide isomerase/thioredoxin
MPLPESWARVLGPAQTVRSEVRADAQGRFELALDGSARVRKIMLSGMGHKSVSLVVVAEGKPVDLTVKLGSYSKGIEPKALGLLLSPGPEMWSSTLPLTPDGDTWATKVDFGDGRYYGRIIDPPSRAILADGWVTVASGTARVVFDPTKRPPPGVAPVVTLGDGPNAALAAAWGEEDRAVLAGLAKNSRYAIVREVAALAYFGRGRGAPPAADDQERAKTLLETLAPDDDLWWILDGHPATTVLTAAGESFDGTYGRRFVDLQPDVDGAAQYLVGVLDQVKDDADRARAIVAILHTPRFAKNFTAKSGFELDPDGPMVTGKPAPSFDVAALVGDRLDPKKRQTPKVVEGKRYLLDVWATWCKPCVDEMPVLHELYAKYGAKGKAKKGEPRLEILSISIDGDGAKVAAFRKDPAHPMPWLLGVADEAESNALFTAFGLGKDMKQVPFYVLVDEHGKIILASPRLNGGTMAATVERALVAP